MRVDIPQLSLEVPLRIVGLPEHLALLCSPAAPHHHQRIAQPATTGGARPSGGAEIASGLDHDGHHVRGLLD